MAKKTKENTLYLTIKQVYFDEILKGTKTKEYREIKDTTFKKYLETWKEDGELVVAFDDEKIAPNFIAENGIDITIWNNGVYPYYAKEFKFLDLAVGYTKDRDTATVEVKNITFEPAKTKKGEIARFDWSESEGIVFDKNGEFCVWQVVYHLGKVIKKDLKKDRK